MLRYAQTQTSAKASRNDDNKTFWVDDEQYAGDPEGWGITPDALKGISPYFDKLSMTGGERY